MPNALLVAVIGLVLAVPGGLDAGASRPEDVPAMRMRYLSPERYQSLYAEWKEFAESHPRDGLAWTQLARAGNYAGAPCADVVKWARRGVELAPNSSEALITLGRFQWDFYCEGQPPDPAAAMRLLEKAVAIDPLADDARYHLWVMQLSQGRSAEAGHQLAALLDGGRMPEPLVDFGYNLLVGLEEDAILITNGDNDTYPLVALQAARGFRTDVTVINIGLLSMPWYRRQLARDRGLPVPELPGQTSSGSSGEALRALVDALEREGWKRPFYTAVTVQKQRFPPENRKSLEGLVYRLGPAPGEMTVDEKRLAENLDRRYRRQSCSSLSVDWQAWTGLEFLVRNYVAADWQLASAYYRRNDRSRARQVMERILNLCEVRKFEDAGPVMLKGWKQLDPQAPRLAYWRNRFES